MLPQMFAFKFCEEEWIFAMVVNFAHEGMFSLFWFMMLQDQDVSHSLQ